MHIVIMGCGRVGSLVALQLTQAGHSVSVIDQEESAFKRLGPNFLGNKVVGIGFDRDRLTDAGISSADAFLSLIHI